MRLTVTLSFALFLFTGCANREGIAPSQNASLHNISPSTTATAEGGVIQRGLDSWLKEEWTPLSKPVPSTVPTSSNSVPVSQSVSIPATAPEPDETTPFTLQKYADKWKVYHENKEKLNEGKPKEASHIEKVQSLPVIGK